MHTVELLLDAALDNGVREMWSRLRDAGLPSLATHPHPTNRPHLTVVNAALVPSLDLPLPLPVELGPVRALGRFLVREVTPTEALRELHERVWRSCADAWPPPAEFIPHVSLARRATDEALLLLADEPPARGHFVAARSYDSSTRTVTPL